MSADTEKDLKMVQEAAAKLGEHFDTVQIFATRHEPGLVDGTIRVGWGVGNWFARLGQIQHFLWREKEYAAIEARNDEEKDP